MNDGSTRLDRLVQRFDDALDALEAAKPFAKPTYQTDVFQLTETLIGSSEGMQALAERAHRFDAAGVFSGGGWTDPMRLQPSFVAASLRAGGIYPIIEILSELRVLAIAQERYESELSAEAARAFLEEVMALNLGFLLPGGTEEDRVVQAPQREAVERLFTLLVEQVGLASIRDMVVEEIEQVCAQRPIVTDGVRRTIRLAARIPGGDADDPRLTRYLEAIEGPSPMSRELPDVAQYRTAIRKVKLPKLKVEAEAFARSVRETGLACPHHAVLLRRLPSVNPELIPVALGLGPTGKAAVETQADLVHQLIKSGVYPQTAQCIPGLSGVLHRGLLSRRAVAAGLLKLIDLDLQPEVREALIARRGHSDGVSANAMLLSGVIAMLGQPLGVGQGNMPTCQSARALSLWAQHACGYLLDVVLHAARDGLVEMTFDHQTLRSNELTGGVSSTVDPELDPVSLIVVPHLDRIYDAMMRAVALRIEDGHKWVNPALYGRWIASGFTTIFLDRAQTTVSHAGDFVRRFYATHHPDYTEHRPLAWPNPVGLCVTSSQGKHLGPHAVTLQRVARDPSGVLRIYFYNPNNEGRQDWGHGVRPSVRGHGEEVGESSLPFEQFVSRLYAFHYNPYEEGDAWAVPAEVVREVTEAARKSWGQSFRWVEEGRLIGAG